MLIRWSALVSLKATAIVAGVALAAVIGGAALFHTQAPASSNLPDSGPIGSTLGVPGGLAITVDRPVQGSSRWLFHIHVRNTSGNTVPMFGVGQDHQFVLLGSGLPSGTTLDQSTVKLNTPSAVERVSHPGLAETVAANATADGWMVGDLSTFNHPVFAVAYRYDTLHSQACKDPRVQSTCHPEDLYRVVVWSL